MKIARIVLLTILLLVSISAAADAYETYNLAWSGAPFDNGAMATGQIVIDLTTLPNPGGPAYDMYGDILSLSVTVTGAGSGNGTWFKDDLTPSNIFGAYTYWDTGGGALNMYAELVGQQTLYGGLWGTPDGFSGDFNLFFGEGGPFGTYYFTMTTNGGNGDPMLLTEFAPVNSVPEPSTFILLGGAIFGFGHVLRRRRDL